MGGRLRFIRTSIWNDDKFPFLSDDEKLVFLHLLSTPQANAIGLFSAGIGSLADEMRWEPGRYRAAFNKLCDTSTHTSGVTFDERSRVVFLRNFFRHNIPNNHNHWKSWLKCYSEVPDCPTRDEWIKVAMGYAKQWGPLYVSALYEIIGESKSNHSGNVTPNHPDTSTHTYTHTSGVTGKGKRKGRGRGTQSARVGEDLKEEKHKDKRQDKNKNIGEQTSHLSGLAKEIGEGVLQRWPTYEIMHALQVCQVLLPYARGKTVNVGKLLDLARESWPDDRPLYGADGKNALHSYLVSWFRNAETARKKEAANEPYYPDLTHLK